MAGIDWCEPRREQGQNGRLRHFQVEDDLVVALHRYRLDIGVPAFAKVDFEGLLTLVSQEIPGALDVGCGKWLAVVPSHAFTKREGQLLAVRTPGPTLRKIGYDPLKRVLPRMWIE